MAGLAQQVEEWLLREALGQPRVEQVFATLCNRLTGIGIPIARARLSWPTLHPLFRAEMVKWQPGDQCATLDHFPHQDVNSPAWQESPMRYMLEGDLPIFRRRLSGPEKTIDFPILEELAEDGFTDYVALSTQYSSVGPFYETKGPGDRGPGIMVIWASRRPNGFTDDDIGVLQEIQLSLALVCKSIIKAQITTNIVETYLGREAGRNVLNGAIRLGDGATTRALVWYSDLRNSTRLTGRLSSEDFLELLNLYFECAARPAIRAGGEVLAFIGDAVLVIFPVDETTDMAALARTVLTATEESLAMRDAMNAERKAAGLDLIEYGIGLSVGDVVFGNIGIPERLAFTVIGATVTEVQRIEKLTKFLPSEVLATAEIAGLGPEDWRSVGTHALAGVEQPMELFAPAGIGERQNLGEDQSQGGARSRIVAAE